MAVHCQISGFTPTRLGTNVTVAKVGAVVRKAAGRRGQFGSLLSWYGRTIVRRLESQGSPPTCISTGWEQIMNQEASPIVGVIMGSKSDWDTMAPACEILEEFGIAYEKKVLSAHRTPELAAEFAQTAEQRGMRVIIAGAGGSAHLPGMVASLTLLPVLGVPVQSRALSGLDSLLSIVQMPGGVPVASLSIGASGAKNAALLSVRMLATSDAALREKLGEYLEEQKRKVIANSQL